ncbi:MAG: acyl-CoA thioesterase [Promethearchaeota archaeon]
MTEILEGVKQRFLKIKDTTRIKVRMNDTDAMGIVHFKNYMVYFDDGFVSLMNNIAHPRRIEDSVREGIACGVKHIDITYENSAKFGDYLIVKSQIKDIGHKSIIFHHEIFNESNKNLLATVDCVRFFIDLNKNEIIDATEFLLDYTKLDDPP